MGFSFFSKRNSEDSHPNKTPLTVAKATAVYERPDDFIQFLPWYEWDDESQTILLHDGRSVGAVLTVYPLATEGRSLTWLTDIRNQIQDAIQDSLDEEPNAPWIMQMFAWDERDLNEAVQVLKEKVPLEKRDAFSEDVLGTYERHIRGIAKDGGIFHDKEVTDTRWGARNRQIKLLVYRHVPKGFRSFRDMSSVEELQDTVSKLQGALSGVGARTKRDTGKDFYRWMLRFFNPAPSCTDGDFEKFLSMAEYVDNEELPYGDDFAESLFFDIPRSDAASQTWWFNDKPMRCIRADSLRRRPNVGQLTGEVVSASSDGKAACMLDRLPEGSMISITTIITPQNEVEADIERLVNRSRGDSSEAMQTKRACSEATELMAEKHKLFRANIAVYVRGEDLKDLRTKSNQVAGLMLQNHLRPIREEGEPLGLNSFLWNLPFAWDPKDDKHYRATRLMWSQQLASLLPFFGRERGSGNPGLLGWNRGGETMWVDPCHPEDRQQNSHVACVAPSGAGKSVLANNLLCTSLGVHGHRCFVFDFGGSFDLTAQYVATGKTVNYVTLKPGFGASLATFSSANALIDGQADRLAQAASQARNIDEDDIRPFVEQAMRESGASGSFEDLASSEREDVWSKAAVLALAHQQSLTESTNDSGRDILGELEVSAVLAITGGDAREESRLTRADRRMIRDSILGGARMAHDEGRQCLMQDVVAALVAISKNPEYPSERQHRAFEMSQAMSLFCDGFYGELFNSEGEEWPDADLTIVDFGTLGRSGDQAALFIAANSLMTHINNIGEGNAMSGRRTGVYIDEAHLFLGSEILVPAMVRAIKVQRKLSISTHFFTQNVSDWAGPARKILNIVEWFVMLIPNKEEVEQLAEVRNLTEDQKHLLLSCRKEHRKYVEGVVLSAAKEYLVRLVPPSIYLALAATEPEEKAERMDLMKRYGISELEAAMYLGRQMDFARGITSRAPEEPVSGIRSVA